MASALDTPRRSATSRSSRQRPRTDGPPLKRRRYIPGGPGGGGRFQDSQLAETPSGGSGPTGIFHTAPRGRERRSNADSGRSAITLSTTRALRTPGDVSYTRPRRERPPARPRYSSAAAAAAAVADGGEYKPREERGWEEFHPDLDVEAELMVFNADDVDGIVSTPIKGLTNSQGLGIGQAEPYVSSYSNAIANERAVSQNGTLSLKAEKSTITLNDEDLINAVANEATSPVKRRPGRPPTRRAESMLHGLGSPPAPRIQPIPTHNPKERLNLPRPSYRNVETFKVFEQDQSVAVNYVDRSMASVGYQESEIFARPAREAYIRGGEASIEEELDLVQAMKADAEGNSVTIPIGRVEYDMDEQDERWLEAINAQRRTEEVEAIKPWTFEFTMTQIEKEWHALEKRIPKPNPKPPQTHRPRSSSAVAVNGEPGAAGEEQDTKCAICDDGDCENTNAIVFCDGCDLAVHQECYGVPFIPEGQWLCRKCQLGGRGSPFACIFCPNSDGAFKQTSTMKWSHLLCAIWIPEVSLGNTTFMEPVMDVEKVPKQRWKLTCYICQQKMGACIQCGNKNCFTAFHVTCARRARLFLKMKSTHGGPANLDASVLKAFCDKHCPSDWRRENDVEGATYDAKDFYRRQMRDVRWPDSQQAALAVSGAQAPIASDNYDDGPQDDATGTKRKVKQLPKGVWRLPSGAPIVPQAVYVNVESVLGRFGIRKRKDFAAEACKYWTLKREARRGASLLKRLQLQMETFTSMEITRRNFAGMGAAGGPRLKRRIDFAEQLEGDMEQIRIQCENVHERERRKLEDAEILKEILDIVYFPVVPLLWPILEKAQTLDPKEVFKSGLDELQIKLEERYYTSVKDFSADLGSVFSSVIGLDAISDAMSSNDQANGVTVPHNALTAEQKEKKKLARRIIKAVQGALEEALRKEAQLGNKPFDRELKDMADLEALLETRHRPTHDPSLRSGEGEDGMEIDEAAEQLTEPYINGHHSKRSGDKWAAEFDPTADKENDESQDRDEVTDEAAIRLQLGDGTDSIPIPGVDVDTNVGTSIDVVPALSHAGSTNPSTTHPLTPPQAADNLLEPIRNGGIPWYLQPFDISGTTIMEERWTGPDVLRDMSEELSEIEDDVLNQMEEDVDMADANDAEANGIIIAKAEPHSAVKSPVKKKPKRKKPIGW